ncbi:disks large-associated protein 5-like isoform X2 [Apis cerana]|uniref:disks large-associated protein 5-like isoform X2 n=1 Tax=Apis cerana TaxID=7461 RepID=UPI00109BA6EE|nr:disks large-associated protein 5-like isoform X2 [Apis cerana]
MSSFRQQYKSIGTKTVSKNRLIRAEKHKDLRKVHRANTFNENRNISITTMNTQAEDRINKLKKWKAEREKQRKIEQKKKKRPFVVGIVHHKIYSPINNCNAVPVTKTTKTCEPVPKRITRATEKRLMNKAITKEIDKTSLKNLNVLNKNQESQKKNKSFAPEGHKFRAPSGLLHIPLYGREVIQSMSPVRISQIMNTSSKTPRKSNKINISQSIKEDIKEDIPGIDTKLISTDIEEDSSIESISLRLSSDEKEKLNISYTISDSNDIKVMANNSMKEVTCSSENKTSPLKSINSQCEPAFFSPHIVSSRGKSNARKEQQLRHGFSHSLNDDIPTKDNVMKNLNISVEEEERTAQYFQFLLNKEIDRLNELCEKWMKIKAEPETIEDGQYEINQAIGQTNLLISKKFERFRGLVADCETGRGEMLVTCKDLQGFWDMMYMEIKNCDLRFKKLEKLRSQGWKEEEIIIVKPIIKKKSTVKKKIVSTKSSSIRAILAEKKKNMAEKMKDNNSTSELESNLNHILNNECKTIENPNMYYEKKSISIDSKENKFTPVKHNKRSSLLQKVQLSDLSMKTKSPLTMIKISQMYKAPKIQLDDSISYINSNQTPGKGILKQRKNLNEMESHTKSINKVNFDDQMALNEISPNETGETKINLTRVSAIDSFDLSNSDEIAIKVERKLLFDDTNFNDSLNDVKKDSENKSIDGTLSSINIGALTPLQEQKNVNETSKKIIKQNAIDNENDVILNETLTLNTNINSTPSKEIIDDKDLNILNEKLEKNVCITNKEEIDEHNGSIRVLRNRIVTSTDTPRAKRRSSKKISINEQELEYKENETPLERRIRRSRVNINTGERRNIELVCYSCNDNKHLEKSNDKRKSTRSVKFSDKESNDGTNKSILPLTPHVRRSKNKNKRSTLLEDSISLEIEEKPPQRVRRSQNKKSSI